MSSTTRGRDTALHALGTLMASIIGNLHLVQQALASGATDQPVAAWLRTAEEDAQRIEALRREISQESH